ncbi:hypothetical protein RINTHH_2410 [Richelia intracellularis HH01]|uniref:Uncharacterized protein n=1 Tax=Richelia intracellularis HH01 TaxID=1165094 RepID=M1X4M3_9NOST|nr:hypothetical protein RINTHH_2410 [Richelia intracellularis HH01]
MANSCSRYLAAISSALSYTKSRFLIMSPGSGSNCLVDKEIRPLSASKSMIMTFNSSFTLKTLWGVSICSWEISEMWSKPLTPPISMNAPYGLIPRTVPITTSPTSKRFIFRSTKARRCDNTNRLRSSSTSKNFSGSSSPNKSSFGLRVLI